ncbi:putative -domain-containing protein [Neofusicoccum parvum UCRNP2]|uniref:Putative-domain-containing protein n=1 Tax=Botryosphaeria parva (strain UCR-NP2) TaxID=1287680 RepID=R1EIQ7_BOTPV|nr:putative -domain-containing protein [Neofusicoccum parvum UCRNP2]
MPLFLSFNVLMFFMANAIPPKIKRVAHPVIVTALFSVLGIWVLALTKGMSLQTGLNLYRTETSYLHYFRGTRGLPLPGAGDILASLLDASIVSLAMPMYQYRRELARYFIAILGPVVALTLPSLFGYPPLCFAFGVSAARSLAMAPRSVTLALAQLSAENLGGELAAISPIAVVSGISGPIFGPTILRLLRIPKGMVSGWRIAITKLIVWGR